jgi:hypothetical protein
MKTMSLKNIAAACGACLFLFTLSANAGLITFDNLPNSTGGVGVPSGYGGLEWDNFYCVNGLTNEYNPSGYKAGVVSKNNDVFNGYGESAEIYVDQGLFILNSACLTAAWNDNLQVQIRGYLRGRQVYNRTFTLSATKPTTIRLGMVADDVEFSSFGGTPHSAYGDGGEHFVMDNLNVIVLK